MSNTMKIRTAAMADLDAIASLERRCFPAAEAADRDSIRDRLAVYPDRFWLIEDNGKLAAMVNGMATDEPDLTDKMYEDAGKHRENGCWQMIFGVDTDPAYRKQGCAARLLEYAIAESRKRGCAGLVLTCKEHLLHYYAKFGFVNEGVSRSTHGGAVWYQMRLTF